MITIVGSLNMDLVVRTPRMPRLGETLSGGPFATYPGGKGANQAVAAARLGAQVAMIGRVGDDDFGRALRETIVLHGVDATAVSQTQDTASGVALITVDLEGQNTIILAAGANGALTPADVDAAAPAITASRVLLLQLEVPLPAVQRAAELAYTAGAIVVLNPAPAPNTALPPSLLACVDYLVPNEIEAAALIGEDVPEDDIALARVTALSTGVKACIVTLGSRGAILVDAGGVHQAPAFPVRAVDSTAAGDAFIGGFAVALARGRSPDEALRWGCAAGALAVTRAGAQASLPSRAELEMMLGRAVRRANT